jgi:N-acetyl-gamma-glutamylphosphate reductase
LHVLIIGGSGLLTLQCLTLLRVHAALGNTVVEATKNEQTDQKFLPKMIIDSLYIFIFYFFYSLYIVSRSNT